MKVDARSRCPYDEEPHPFDHLCTCRQRKGLAPEQTLMVRYTGHKGGTDVNVYRDINQADEYKLEILDVDNMPSVVIEGFTDNNLTAQLGMKLANGELKVTTPRLNVIEKHVEFSIPPHVYLSRLDKSRPILVIYHADCADGLMAAAMVGRYFHQAKWDGPISFHSMAYKDEFNHEVKDCDIIIVDFSLPMQTMIQICEQAHSVIVLDHHVTAVEDILMNRLQLKKLPFDYYLCTDPENKTYSGAGLAYRFFKTNNTALERNARQYALIAQYYDLWIHDGEPNHPSVAFNAWMKSIIAAESSATRAVWNLTFIISHFDSLAGYIREGEEILRPTLERINANIQANRRLCRFKGYEVPIVPCSHADASVTGSILSKDYPFSITYDAKPNGLIEYSLRKRQFSQVDLSELAKSMGGGGHKSAAGFRITALPEQIVEYI